MNIELTPPQSEFFQIKNRFPLFVGGFGSGKTVCLRTCAFADFFDYPGSDVAMYSATYDLLELTIIKDVIEWLSTMPVRFKYIGSPKYTLHVQGYGKMIFRSLSNPERIIGYEVFRSHVDELDTLPAAKAKRAWNKIIARQRQHIIGADGKRASNQVRAYTTPEGYQFAYQRWVKGASDRYVRVHAPTSSNPHNDEDYVPSLYESYSEGLREAYLEGRFTNLHSGNVYSSFNRDVQHEDVEIDKHEVLHLGLDFNVTNVNATVNVIRNGLPLTGAEITKCMDTPAFIDTVKERYPQRQIVVYPDNNGDSRNTTGASQTDIKLLRNAGFVIVPVRDEKKHKKNPRVKNRVNTVNAMCKNMNDQARWKVDTNKCPELTEALEQQAWDSNGMPEKDPETNVDDLNDAQGYFLWSKWPLVKRESSTNQVLAA